MNDFIEIIRRNCTNAPDRIAVIDGNTKINYADFFRLFSTISFNLRAFGDKPKVVFDLNQGIESYALIVATLNVGGIFCPLNPDAPLEKKLSIINEFNPDLVVVENNIHHDFSTSQNIISVHELTQKRRLFEVDNCYDKEDIVYVIYTSGSTGFPKGVMICRKALNKFLEWSIPTYGANQYDIWGQFSLLSFDLSIVDIFTCLCSGATLLVMADAPSKLRPSSVISKRKVTIWHSVPSAIDFMIKSDESKKADFSTLRLMSFCGEPLRKYHLDFLFKKNRVLSVFNTYGPTEGTLFCTWQEFNVDNYIDYSKTSMCIGKTIPGWNIHLDPAKNTTEKEIIIYGSYIGKGYLGKVSNSGFKYIHVENKNVNAFVTGDLVIEDDGNLYFSCRKDRQVKILGNRVELDEIDDLNRKFFNKQSATICYDNALYSFIETEQKIDEFLIRKFLSKKLESYKIPRSFIAIKSIPRNPNCKINIRPLIELIQ